QVNRQRQTWDQNLRLARMTHGFNFNNMTKIKQITNAAQNDYVENRASDKLTIDTRRRGWTLGMDTFIKRDNSQNNFSTRRDNSNQFDLRAERTLKLPLLHPVHFAGTAGYALDSDLSERVGGGAQATKRDSTVERGTTWSSNLTTSGAITPALSYSAGASYSGADQTSETTSYLDSVFDRVVEDDNIDRRRDFNLRTTWDPENDWKATLNTKYTSTQYENYDFQEEQKETKLGKTYNLDGTIEGPLHEGVNLAVTAKHYLFETDYRVKQQDTKKLQDDIRTEFRLEPAIPLLKGSTVRYEMNVTTTRNEREGSKSYDTNDNKTKLTWDRPLRSDLQLVAVGEMQLRQDIYDDGTLDKDEFRTRIDGTLNYNPNKRFSARLSYQREDKELINIPAAKATGNSTIQRNRISARYKYLAGKRLTFEQTFSMSADYTFYKFNESGNTLRRTNEVKTVIEPNLSPNTSVKFEHQYRFGDSGGYQYNTLSGIYTYGPSSETLRQYLLLRTEYKIRRSISLVATQSYEARTTTTLSTMRESLYERVQFSGEARFEHKFSEGFTFNGSFQQTQSSAEDDYWLVEASLNRDF
ncbi:MAG: hypothetical protein KJ927_20725, partial [Candidatus Eisenbacteria bacterium]|nr:hypothetical protein [Candidatus Eisenbacteria bacterium]